MLGLTSVKYAGGGGILILADWRLDEEAEFVEFTAQAATPAPSEPTDVPVASVDAGPVPSGPHIALDENAPEADPPESFEVSRFSLT